MTHELQFSSFKNYLAPRKLESNKGDFGRVLIIGGDYGFSGAVRLAGEAALRVGAGSVSIMTRPEHAFTLNVSCPELMCHGTSPGVDMDNLLERSSFIVIGPGLGVGKWSKDLLNHVLSFSQKPLLLDADALNILAKNDFEKRNNWILTPHPGEAARLYKTTVQHIQENRLDILKGLQQLFGGIIVLKGAGTLILSENDSPSICHAGNPGMATAGMGDVLSGVIAGLAAQNISLLDAVKLGVLIHAMAGDLAAVNGQRGMIASDLLPYLRKLVNIS